MSKHEWEPFRAVFDLAMDRLIVTLREAQDYLGAGEDLAAIGTLHTIDDLYADVHAALRLFTSRRLEKSD